MSNESYYATSSFSYYPAGSTERVIHKANEKVDVSKMSEKEIENFLSISKIRKTSFESLSHENEFLSIYRKYSSVLSEIESSTSREAILEKSKTKIFELYNLESMLLEKSLPLQSKYDSLAQAHEIILNDLKKSQEVHSKLNSEMSDLKNELNKSLSNIKKLESDNAKLEKENKTLIKDLDKATK